MGTQAPPTGMSLAERPAASVQATETSSSAVAAREKAAVEARFLVAISRPRNPDLARQRLLRRCESPVFADVAEYSKPIGGKKVTGGSIRLMEEIGRQWGNIDIRADITFDDQERRIVHVSATDLETNYSQSVDVILEKTVERKFPKQGETVLSSRTNSKGETVYRIEADEDSFFTKQNANVAKARREMIRAVVPGDLVEEAISVARNTRRNEDAKDPAGSRKRIADSFFQIGVMANQLCEYLEKPSLEAVTDAEVEVLRQLYTSIKEGETTWTEIIADKKPTPAQGSEVKVEGKGSSGLKNALGVKKKDKQWLINIPNASGQGGKVYTAVDALRAHSFGEITLTQEQFDAATEAAERERTD